MAEIVTSGPSVEAGAGQVAPTGTHTFVGGDVLPIPNAGLDLPPNISFDRWVLIGRALSRVHGSSAWCLGDWLLHGEDRYTGRYRDAVESCSLNYQTLRNYAWVARRFPLSRRRDTLSFGHHAEVAALSEPEQDYWLRKAEELGWSRRQLRAEVRASVRQRSEAGQEQSEPTPTEAQPTPSIATASSPGTDIGSADGGLQLPITSGQVELWQAAAAQAQLSLTDWAVHQLDSAARDAEPI
jgi:hypothetical protein